jgi:hypothetical protein
MTPGLPTPRKVTLKTHSILGHARYEMERETIPQGAEVTILNADHSDTESLIEWAGRQLIVDKDSLITFEEHD